MDTIKQAIISAGGLGTRLRPATDTMPKPMIPILGKPILQWHVEQFKKFGVAEFFFALHHLPKVVMDHFGDGSKFGVNIRYLVEKEPLGTAGGMKKFEPQLDEEFFYIYGDTFSLMNYGKMEAAWRALSGRAIGIQRVGRSESYADVDIAELDAQKKITAIHPKPHDRRYADAYRMRGSFIFSKKILSYIPEDVPYEIGRQLLPDIVAHGEAFYGYECDDYSKGIDTVEKWKEVEEYLIQLRRNPRP